MKRIHFGVYILCIAFISCATTVKITSPLPELSLLETVVQMVKQNSPEIEKYFLFEKTGETIVKADLAEKRHGSEDQINFQVLYDLKHIQIESSDEYLIPFTVKCLETGEVQEDKLLWKPQKDNAGILLSLDDHYFDAWERYFDMFDRYNAKVTFFVVGQHNSFCTAAINRGHDVGYHTLTHLDLTDVTRQDFYTETVSQVENFRNAGARLVSFAYPFGFFEPWMHEELLKTYRILRGFNVSFQAYDRITISNGFVFSRSIDNILFKEDDDFKAMIDSMLRTLKFTGQDLVLPLTSHDIAENADWGIKPHRLEYLLQVAGDLQLNFYTYRDFF
jgi:hypothetical protein